MVNGHFVLGRSIKVFLIANSSSHRISMPNLSNTFIKAAYDDRIL